MARKIRAKLIMELREQSMSRRSIAKTRRMSMESVCEVFGIAEERDISRADVEPLTGKEAYRLFYPDRGIRESVFEDPDWGYVHKEMAKVGVNLRLLHDEYRERCVLSTSFERKSHRFLSRVHSGSAQRLLTKHTQPGPRRT